MSDLLLQSVDAGVETVRVAGVETVRSAAKPRQIRRHVAWSNGRAIAAALLRFTDMFVIAAAAAITFWLGPKDADQPAILCLEVAVMVLLAGSLFESAGLYSRSYLDNPADALTKLALIYAAAAATVLILGHFLTS
ncbi:MAG: hypothetical protein JO107_11280, partial [Hyphomicrobiales bacterium]|nr:hypothetical protein [Hyphomicrobiales bacterium]